MKTLCEREIAQVRGRGEGSGVQNQNVAHDDNEMTFGKISLIVVCMIVIMGLNMYPYLRERGYI